MSIEDVTNPFMQKDLDLETVEEYYSTNQAKKDAEKKLKKMKPIFFSALKNMGKRAANIGDYIVENQIRNTSKVDEEALVKLVLEKAEEHPVLKGCLDYKVNEEKLTEYITQGLLDIQEVQEKCYISSTSNALIVKKKKK